MVATTFLESRMKIEGTLSRTTRQAFDYIWRIQSDSGAWRGGSNVTGGHMNQTIRITRSARPEASGDEYTQSPQVRRRTNALKFPRCHPESSTSACSCGQQDTVTILSKKQVKKWQDELFSVQKLNGGWVLPELGDKKISKDLMASLSPLIRMPTQLRLLSSAG